MTTFVRFRLGVDGFMRSLAFIVLSLFSVLAPADTSTTSTDTLIVLDHDGLGYLVQLTLTTETLPIDISISEEISLNDLQLLMPGMPDLKQALSEGKGISISHQPLIVRYHYRFANLFATIRHNLYELPHLPVSAETRDSAPGRQTATWIFPADIEVVAHPSGNSDHLWRKEGNSLHYRSKAWTPKPAISYRFHDQDNDGTADRLDHCADTLTGFPTDTNGCPLDSDKDGVLDGDDRCQGSGIGEPVDQSGCPFDFDGDGVANYADQCRGSLAGQTVDSVGCEADTDRDGIFDRQDRCSATPLEVSVDSHGCSLDSDGDLVPDYRDVCHSRDQANIVNGYGCIESSDLMVLDGLSFLTGSSHLSIEARTILDRVASAIKHQKPISVEVGAHTDNKGKWEDNRDLSKRRADSVRQYLMIQGVSPNHLVAMGYGEIKPRVPNLSPEHREINRRVEIRVTAD